MCHTSHAKIPNLRRLNSLYILELNIAKGDKARPRFLRANVCQYAQVVTAQGWRSR